MVILGEQHDAQPFEQQEGAQDGHAARQAEPVAGFVAENAAQGPGEKVHQAEQPGQDAGLGNAQPERVDEVQGGNVVDGDLHAEAGAVGQEQAPHPPVAAGRPEAARGFFALAR
jgi:hypothetical protein